MRMLRENKNYLGLYPNTMIEIMTDIFTMSDTPKPQLKKEAIWKFLKKIPLLKFAWDMWKAKGMF